MVRRLLAGGESASAVPVLAPAVGRISHPQLRLVPCFDTLAAAGMNERPQEPPTAATEGARRERVITLPLAVFLVVVALGVGFGLWHRYPRPDLAGGVVLLADGDLDGDERVRLLRRVLAQARTATRAGEQWAGYLAAIALADRPARQELLLALGGGPRPAVVPEPGERTFLDLGDRMLGAVLAAGVAEVAGDVAVARRQWELVQSLARLTAHAYGSELALEALQRLP